MRTLKKVLSLVLVLTMVMSLGVSAFAADAKTDYADYTTIKDTHKEAVDVMTAVGVFNGISGSFKPTDTLTRAMAAKILTYMLLGQEQAEKLVTTVAPFSDVPASHWAAGSIAYCANEGILAGVGDGSFKPEDTLTGLQFAKMLEAALGYDAKAEGLTGDSWAVNAAKLLYSNSTGLSTNLGTLSSTDALTREEAAQMALNAVQAPLVEYNGTSIVVGDTTVVVGGNGATYVTTTIAKTQTISDRRLSNTDDFTIEFGEKYMPNLVKGTGRDDFGRPSYTWEYQKKDIDTYPDYSTLVASYTAAVTGGEVYDDIGSTSASFKNVSYFINGVDQSDDVIDALMADVRKNNKDTFGTDTDGKTGNSVLTQVFVDSDKETIDVIVIDTYLAQVDADYDATRETLQINILDTTRVTSAPTAVYLEDAYNITDYKDGNYIMVQVADGVVVNVLDPDVLEEVEVSRFSQDKGDLKYVVTDGKQYNTNYNISQTANLNDYNKEALTDSTYDLYIDQYGNLIGAILCSSSDRYLFLVGYDLGNSALSARLADASVIFTDGTMQTVKINVADSREELAPTFAPDTFMDPDDGNISNHNRWYTYTEKDGVYTLTAVGDQVVTDNTGTSKVEKLNVENVRVVDKTDPTTKRAYGNDESIYITVEAKGKGATDEGAAITKVTGTYTGAQDVDIDIDNDLVDWVEDGIVDDEDITETIWALRDSEKYIIAAIVRGEETGSATRTTAYGLKGAQYEEYKDGYYYWEFQAAVDGKVQNLIVRTEYKKVIEDLQDVIPTVDNVGDLNGDDRVNQAALIKLTFDKDGTYVTNAEIIDDSTQRVYGDTEWQTPEQLTDAFIAYLVEHADATLHADGRTLQVDDDNDVGVTIASGAPVVVIQKNSGETALNIVEYSSLEAAVKAVAMNGNGRFTGIIAAGLNERGTANWLVIESRSAEPSTGRPDADSTAFLSRTSMFASEYEALGLTYEVSNGGKTMTISWSNSALNDKLMDLNRYEAVAKALTEGGGQNQGDSKLYAGVRYNTQASAITTYTVKLNGETLVSSADFASDFAGQVDADGYAHEYFWIASETWASRPVGTYDYAITIGSSTYHVILKVSA